MDIRAVARVLSGFALFFSLAQAVPLAVACLDEPAAAPAFGPADGFGFGIGAGLAVAAALALAGRGASTTLYRREAIAVVGLAWPLAGALGAVPFWCSGALPTFVDAFFESVSGLTTCGSSVLGSPVTRAIEELPPSLLLWRSMEQWLGGMGIVLVFVVLLPRAGVVGRNLLSAEGVGVPAEGAALPRLQVRARGLCLVYLVLTLLNVIALQIAGMGSWFDATCHAFTTLSTGGFSTRNASIGAYRSVAVEVVTIAFMVVAGMNFGLLLNLARGRFRDSAAAARELRLYVVLMVCLVLGIATTLYARGGIVDDRLAGARDYSSFATCVRDAAFNLVSNQTCTGFATADYQAWPGAAIVLLMVAMLVGGCTGSTSGGIKVMRLLICGKLVAHAMRQLASPRSVGKIRVGPDVVPNSVVSAAMAMVLMWLLSIAAGAFAMLLDSRVDLLAAVSAPTSAMACCGPAMSLGGVDVGPAGSFGLLSAPAKLLLAAQMILGRLEILAPISLLLPGFWRR